MNVTDQNVVSIKRRAGVVALLAAVLSCAGCVASDGKLYLMQHPGMERTDEAVAGVVNKTYGDFRKWALDQIAKLRLELLKKRDAVQNNVNAVAASQPAVAKQAANDAVAEMVGAAAKWVAAGGLTALIAKIAHLWGKKSAPEARVTE